MIHRAQSDLQVERKRLLQESHALANERESLNMQQLHVEQDRKRLDDEMLQRFMAKSEVDLQLERRHFVVEKQVLAEERRQLEEERRQMSLVDAGAARLAQEAHALALERRRLVAEWRHHWQQLANASLEVQRRPTADERLVADERRWLHVERCRLADEANRLRACGARLETDRQRLAQEADYLIRHRSELDADAWGIAGPARELIPLELFTPARESSPPKVREIIPLELCRQAREPSPPKPGRLDELYLNAQCVSDATALRKLGFRRAMFRRHEHMVESGID